MTVALWIAVIGLPAFVAVGWSLYRRRSRDTATWWMGPFKCQHCGYCNAVISPRVPKTEPVECPACGRDTVMEAADFSQPFRVEGLSNLH